MKYQNSDLQNENPKNSSSNSNERMLTPEEGTRMLQEAEEAGRKYREYMIQRRKMEEQRKSTK